MAWQFLARGASVAEATAGLDRLLLDAERIQAAVDEDQIVLAQRYLRWCDQVETQLQDTFAELTLSRGLFTDRHWQIRGIDDTTRMAFGMVKSEVRDQSRLLRALRHQIEHYAALVEPDESESLIMLDTNVFVHGQPFGNVRWEREVRGTKARILVPLIIVDELDKLKDRNDSARAVLRTLDAMFVGITHLPPLTVRDGVTLQVIDEPAGHVRLARADDEIVRQALYFAAVSESPVTLFTRDRGMRIRALASGIDARMLPPNLERRQPEEEIR